LINFDQVKGDGIDEESDWDSISKSKFSKFHAEAKFDGIRMLAQKIDGKIKIHRGLDNVKNEQFPEVLKQLSDMPDNTLYDGELCILNPNDELLSADFSAIQKRNLLKDSRKIDFLSNKNPATFMAFDCLMKNGVEIFYQKPLSYRKQQIENCIKTLEYKPNELMQMIQKNEMEGIVIKDPNGIGNKSWVKFKNWVETTYKIIGTKGLLQGLSQNISCLELEDLQGNAVGHVNYTFNEPEMQTDQIKQKLIGSYVEVRSMFTSKGKVRFPSIRPNEKDKLIKFLKSGRNLEEDFSRKSVQEILQ